MERSSFLTIFGLAITLSATVLAVKMDS
ncbi:hypothetical protein KW796_02745 [Candidatus Parcubacteria bacterium]|nr:hypothetical protein [Candidatus Parcubacteria bacterium]